jgi:hypothetical protein
MYVVRLKIIFIAEVFSWLFPLVIGGAGSQIVICFAKSLFNFRFLLSSIRGQHMLNFASYVWVTIDINQISYSSQIVFVGGKDFEVGSKSIKMNTRCTKI